MIMSKDLSQAQLSFQIEGHDLDRFLVNRYRGSEGLCRLYRFEVDLTCEEAEVDFDAIVGKPAVLSISADHGERWFHGIVGSFEMTGETAGQTYYRAELVPAVWLLTHRYDSRIFQNKSVREIVSDVLTRAGIASDRFKFLLEKTHPSRDYCVQYRETDYNFICRLMEDEGIRWYFEQSEEDHVLVMADSPAANAPIEGDAALPYVPPSGMIADEEHVFRFRRGQSVRPGGVRLREFNFEKPALKLDAGDGTGPHAGLEFCDYPGEFASVERGKELALLRAEEFETGRVVGVGQSNSHRLAPGRTFELTGHPAASHHAPYLITAVTHEGRQSTHRTTTGLNGPSVRGSRGDSPRLLTSWLYHAGQVSRDLPSTASACGGNPLEPLSVPSLLEEVNGNGVLPLGVEGILPPPVYTCRFECIPASVSYRPPRVTPWPVMRGTQTARVVGPAGEEIHTDPYGRVKVQFNWDREGKFDENASCWIRVSQGMAGGGYGMMFLPRVGQEVVVDFLEGNPDKPLVVGRVYNADHMPPYKLPKQKTKSVIKTHSTKGGGGTNEIQFEDLKDQERILVYAQKDLHLRANNDHVENVGHDHHLTVKENKFELVKKCKHADVTLDLNERIGGNKSLEVKGDVAEEFKGNHSETVKSNHYLKSESGSIVLEASTDITLKVGGNFVKVSGDGIWINGKEVFINSGGSAGSGSAAALGSPESPIKADSASPGQDVRYDGGDERTDAEAGPDLAGHRFEPTEAANLVTWIEIELVDEAGQPCPHERYEIKAPDGTTLRRGSLDKNGLAHVSVPEPGTCRICFPNLDAQAWERI